MYYYKPIKRRRVSKMKKAIALILSLVLMMSCI